MMHKMIGVTELQRQFSTILDEVVHTNTPYVLTRDTQPKVAMIPYEAFVQFQIFQEKMILERFDRFITRMAHQNGAYSEAEIMADIEEVRLEFACEL